MKQTQRGPAGTTGPVSGVYLVKVDGLPARRVVVVR